MLQTFCVERNKGLLYFGLVKSTMKQVKLRTKKWKVTTEAAEGNSK